MSAPISVDESSTTDVRIISTTMRIKNEFESEDENEKKIVYDLINSPIRCEEITLQWPPFLYKESVDYDIDPFSNQKDVQAQGLQLLQTIRDAVVSTSNDTYASMAIIAEEISAERKRVYRTTTWPTYVATHLRSLFAPTSKAKNTLTSVALPFNEVIPENQPVHLYLDIDADLVASTVAKFQMYVEKLDEQMNKLCKYLEEFIMVRFSVESVYTVRLFSHDLPFATLLSGGGASAGKYSTHIVMHMSGGEVMFKNSQHLGNFINDFYYAMHKVRPDLVDIKLSEYGLVTSVTDKNQTKSLFDMNVYRRNGELRMPYSSKFANPKRKMMPVILSGIDERRLLELYDFNEPDPVTKRKRQLSPEEGMFYAGLVTFVPKKVTVTHLLSHQRANVSLKRANALTPAELLPTLQDKPILFGNTSGNNSPTGGTNYSSTNSDSNGTSGNNNVSDYDFLELLSNDIQSEVPTEYFCSLTLLYILPPGIVVFSSKGTYCEIKQDNHRSNHTFYVCHLTKKQYYQRCFDEECKRKMDTLNQDLFGSEPNDDTVRFISTTAKGRFRYFSLDIWQEITNFLERHKTRLEVKKRDEETGEPDPKQQRKGDIANYFFVSPGHDQNRTVQMVTQENKGINVSAILQILMEEMRDLK